MESDLGELPCGLPRFVSVETAEIRSIENQHPTQLR